MVSLLLEVCFSFLRGEGPLCEQRVPSPHTPHPPKNFACHDASQRGIQDDARLQPSQTLYRSRDGGSPSGMFFHVVGGRVRRATPCRGTPSGMYPAKSFGKGEGEREGERENRFPKRFPSPSRIKVILLWGEGPFVNKGSLPPTPPHPPKNFVCHDANQRGIQDDARRQPSQTLYRSRDGGSPSGMFFHVVGGRVRRAMPCRGTLSGMYLAKSFGKGEGEREGEGESRFPKRFPSPSRLCQTSPKSTSSTTAARWKGRGRSCTSQRLARASCGPPGRQSTSPV